MWSSYVREHLLPRIFGFELLMAPYAVAHLKLGMQLAGLDLPEAQRADWAYDFKGDERLGVYLTNTLEEAAKRSERLTMGGYISDEANEAAKVKRDVPVMVVMGNPPYSGHSANKGPWINALLRGKDTLTGQATGNYFQVDGKPLRERNPKWLNDDYVKFIRFAQWRIERTGNGILAFITNHSYLDNPTFRGMRRSLMQSFDEIHLLNLHGSSKKKERNPDGGKDENVFDIQQGVAIAIFVRRSGTGGSTREAKVFHADLWGIREYKYSWLLEHDATPDSTRSTCIEPRSPYYFFKPREAELEAEYEQGWQITKMMPVNVLGFQTHRDHFAIAFDEKTLRDRVEQMRRESVSDEVLATQYKLETSSEWKLPSARRAVRADLSWQSRIRPCLYRPFDKRYGFFSDAVMDRPRRDLLQHMSQSNLSLNVTRQTKEDEWRNAVVANTPTPAVYDEVKDGSNAFPLYVYPDTSAPPLLDDRPTSTAPGGRRPNLAPEFIEDFSNRLGMTWVPDGKGDRARSFGPEDLLSYMYAVFYSPGFRARYNDFLKDDFARLPLTGDASLFGELCALGDELVNLHLMKVRPPTITHYPVKGTDVAEKAHYIEPTADGQQGRVYINDTQYVGGVPPEVWEFYIGGYQVCDKWLKDRKGRVLSYDDLEHYQQIVAALAETIRLMDAID